MSIYCFTSAATDLIPSSVSKTDEWNSIVSGPPFIARPTGSFVKELMTENGPFDLT